MGKKIQKLVIFLQSLKEENMFHELIQIWFGWVNDWGYAGVVILMALESSIVPVPSELVMAPAAFWAAQGKMNFWLVVLAGTVGSYIGSVLSYWTAEILTRWFIPAKKLEVAHRWAERFGMPGIFVARFLPVVRHLISIPAGILKMPFWSFSLATIAGAGIWCFVLAWFGQEVLGAEPGLLQTPDLMIAAVSAQLNWFLGLAILLASLYGVVVLFSSKKWNQ
jgi:membrane protein DedA with SNARE-associated domain